MPPVDPTDEHASMLARMLFDDSVAILDRQLGIVTWVSDSWQAAQPELGVGTAIGEVARSLPEAQLHEWMFCSRANPEAGPPDSNTVVARWGVQTQRLSDQAVALRLIDRRAQSRALQRQLSDRESLLFTSRVLSVGEMATTLAHELNQPIASAANLLRGLKSRLARRADALTDDETA